MTQFCKMERCGVRCNRATDQPDGICWECARTYTRHSGHPRFHELTQLESDLHNRKNADYAGGGKPTGNFDRCAAIMALYPEFPYDTNYGIAMVQMLKQLDAALWLLCRRKQGDIEGVPERLGDVSIYAKLARLMYEEAQTEHIQIEVTTGSNNGSN